MPGFLSDGSCVGSSQRTSLIVPCTTKHRSASGIGPGLDLGQLRQHAVGDAPVACHLRGPEPSHEFWE